jgi:hypothetical protein
MEKILAMKWVEALRSGKYKQGTGQLRQPRRLANHRYSKTRYDYCCLGVLGNICGIGPEAMHGNNLLYGDLKIKCGIRSAMGTPYDEWGYMTEAALRHAADGEMVKYVNLATANDRGVSFRRIASWIEKNYEKL